MFSDMWILYCLLHRFLSWRHHFESFTVTTMIWLSVTGYMCHKLPWICSTCGKHIPIHSSFMHLWLITRFVTRVTRPMPLVEQDLPTLPGHLHFHRWNTFFHGCNKSIFHVQAKFVYNLHIMLPVLYALKTHLCRTYMYAMI